MGAGAVGSAVDGSVVRPEAERGGELDASAVPPTTPETVPRRPAVSSRWLLRAAIAVAVYALFYAGLRGAGVLRDPGVGSRVIPGPGTTAADRTLGALRAGPTRRSIVEVIFLPATSAEIGFNKFKR